MHISFLILSIPLLLLFSCGPKENSVTQGSKPPPVCGEAANSVIMALKGQSLANLDNSLTQTQKVELDCVNQVGMSPLDIAVDQGVNDKLEKILEKGADVNFKNRLGETALHLAAKSGKLNLMQTLWGFRADPNIKDNSGKMPLHLAVQSGDIQATQFLLQKGASLKSVDGQKWTPLHFAANEANLEMIKYLIGLGADLEAKNGLGHTPFFTCQRSDKIKSYSVCQYLKPEL